jgi:hypothetical protein
LVRRWGCAGEVGTVARSGAEVRHRGLHIRVEGPSHPPPHGPVSGGAGWSGDGHPRRGGGLLVGIALEEARGRSGRPHGVVRRYGGRASLEGLRASHPPPCAGVGQGEAGRGRTPAPGEEAYGPE